MASSDREHKKLHGYAFYKSIGSPQYVCAPMVDQSELAFRMLCRKYNTTVCYTPMIHSKLVADQGIDFLNKVFSTAPEDRPLFAQFCGHDPDAMLKACRLIEDKCDAVDMNFGCPQGIAKRGRYGSFLLTEPNVIVALVKKLHENLGIPVTCKIRVLPNKEATLKLAKDIEAAGCSILTVHGRTKEQNKDAVGECDWDIIKKIKEELSIPVFANGGIYTFEDVQRCLDYTGVDGVMSAEGLLENPALFSGTEVDLDEIALEYLDLVEKQYPTPHFFVKSHLFKILHTGLSQHTDLRSKLANLKTLEEQRELVLELKARRIDATKKEKFGWYTRFWEKQGIDFKGYNAGIKNESLAKGERTDGIAEITEVNAKQEIELLGETDKEKETNSEQIDKKTSDEIMKQETDNSAEKEEETQKIEQQEVQV